MTKMRGVLLERGKSEMEFASIVWKFEKISRIDPDFKKIASVHEIFHGNQSSICEIFHSGPKYFAF